MVKFDFKEFCEDALKISNKVSDMMLASSNALAKKEIDLSDNEKERLDYLCDGLYHLLREIIEATNVNDVVHQKVAFEAIDLGLPSGLKWANMNLGAEAPEQLGYLLSFDQAKAYIFADGWKMPEAKDFEELVDNCTSEFTEVNGIKGRMFTSKINGNSAFFPCSGNGGSTSWIGRGAGGYYWSGSLYSQAYGRSLLFYSGGVYPQNYSNRFHGFAVRAVQ